MDARLPFHRLLEELRSKGRKEVPEKLPKIFLLTTSISNTERNELKLAGLVDNVLMKPLRLNMLIFCFKEVLGIGKKRQRNRGKPLTGNLLRNKRILVVDENVINRNWLKVLDHEIQDSPCTKKMKMGRLPCLLIWRSQQLRELVLVQVYDSLEADLKLNDVFEFVGVLTFNLEPSVDKDDSDEFTSTLCEDELSHSPPSKVEYDFKYYKMEMEADVQLLILSEGKSNILSADLVLPFCPLSVESCEIGDAEALKA
ncbi:hypothetical protein TEA_000445 [Camellia sinensis var. sinensis]|uniref:Response regulatory domain-containing protein n=1 Tax=Camellia sinensis var. sinensis TaxID=542762 RepID=A0A4V3WJT8_CAMSN|nr:hypothetical protein TEA_000445 [Camellia sinensis var. sinensis]